MAKRVRNEPVPSQPTPLSVRRFSADYLLAALAAATILSKRLSPRKESQHGSNRRSPYVGLAGIFATISSCSSAAMHMRAALLIQKRLQLRRERGGDLLEPRIAPKRVPFRMKLKPSVFDRAWHISRKTQLFQSQLVLSQPRIDHSKIFDQHRTYQRVLGN